MQKERERERVDLKIDQKTKFRSVKHAREIRNISIGEGGKGGGVIWAKKTETKDAPL